MFKFIKSVWWIVKKNWYKYLLVLFFGIILAVLNLFPARIVGNLTEGIENASNTGQALTKEYLINDIFIPFVTVMVLIYGISFLKRNSQNILTTTIYYELHNKYMKSILAQDGAFFEKFQSGDLLTRALGDINTVKFSAGNRLLNIFNESLTVVVTFVAMILINPILAICCFLPLSLILVSNIILRGKVKNNWKKVREKHSIMNNVVLESITNVRTIRAYSKEEENYQKNLKYSNDAYKVELSNLKINVVFEALFKFIVAISTLICFSLGAYFYYKGYITKVSDLVKFVMYLGLFQSPLTAIGNMINNFYQSLISADRLNEIYDSKNSVVDLDNLEINSIDKIEFKNFKFHYPNDEFNSLNNINLVINKGETIGIVGKTASGKTSLVRQLVRQLPTDSNSIFINDKPIEFYNKENIRKFISYVPQEHVLFSRSVIDNVRLGKDNATQEEIDLAVKMADFNKDLADLTDGYDTIVGEYGVTLSGGQKQRLGIARAFLRNSDVLVLDDSLSAVDGTTEANIIKNLKEYRNGKTNIIVCHRLSAVAHADKIIVLDEGQIVESGRHDDLMKEQGWYYEQYTAQHFKGEVEL